MKTITRNEYLQLIGLQALAAQHYAIVVQCEKAINAMIGPKEDAAVDVILGDHSLEWLLERGGITVEDSLEAAPR